MKILVPVDGSENAFRAIDLACKLASPEDEVLLLNVVGRGELPDELKRYVEVEHIEGPPQWQYEQLVASEMIGAALERVRSNGIRNYDTFVRSGDVARPINAVAADSEAEMLTIDLADVGALVASLNISGRLAGGRLHAALTRHHDGDPWSGPVEAKNVRILQAPLLARLLTMASLPGLLSTLTSDGLTIDLARCDIMIDPVRIRCASTRLSIDRLEITGSIDLNRITGHIEGQGLLIPGAALQRLAGKVPALGAFLEGLGKKDSPILASRFTLSGKASDLEITVQPMSSIAPDLLRKFGIV